MMQFKQNFLLRDIYRDVLQGKDTGHNIHTPYALVSSLYADWLKNKPNDVGCFWLPELAILWAEYGNPLRNFTLECDSKEKVSLAKHLGINYTDMQKQGTKFISMKQFHKIGMNPPFMDGVSSVGATHIRDRFEQNLLPGGELIAIGQSNILSGGQKGLSSMIAEQSDVKAYLNLGGFDVAQDIAAIRLRKQPATSSMIQIENGNKSFTIDLNDFMYQSSHGDKPFIPRNITQLDLPILKKILKHSKDIYHFRSSMVPDGHKDLVSFYAGAKIPVKPAGIRISRTGRDGLDSASRDHPCALDGVYPEDNIRSIFAGRLFHWTINAINGNSSDRRPANLSYFPKFDLTRRWSFDDQCQIFGLAPADKKLVMDWSLSVGYDWKD